MAPPRLRSRDKASDCNRADRHVTRQAKVFASDDQRAHDLQPASAASCSERIKSETEPSLALSFSDGAFSLSSPSSHPAQRQQQLGRSDGSSPALRDPRAQGSRRVDGRRGKARAQSSGGVRRRAPCNLGTFARRFLDALVPPPPLNWLSIAASLMGPHSLSL
ncbi:hypothetical protein PHYPSEUDO_000919 [Phytophthora pseudosyringae]|uniref:Uncharacterized protein n=1 Tax=Phytophthora pseudosyringae TaxID=221518 RepID=A0A8T1VX92_9STRA|nr:hypothetical protein PHYPSEUDO_000919 [Phytophthora pseudosyringae]